MLGIGKKKKKDNQLALKVLFPLRLSGYSNCRSHPGFGVTCNLKTFIICNSPLKGNDGFQHDPTLCLSQRLTSVLIILL